MHSTLIRLGAVWGCLLEHFRSHLGRSCATFSLLGDTEGEDDDNGHEYAGCDDDDGDDDDDDDDDGDDDDGGGGEDDGREEEEGKERKDDGWASDAIFFVGAKSTRGDSLLALGRGPGVAHRRGLPSIVSRSGATDLGVLTAILF